MSACLQAVCPLNCVACFSGRRVWAAARLSGSLAKYRQKPSGYPAVSLFHGLVIWLSGVLWLAGVPSPPQGVCPCDRAETEQCRCFSGGGLFGSWFRAPVCPSGCVIRVNRRAAWRLAARQCAHPGARRLPPWGVPSSLTSGSPPVLCCWQPWFPAVGGPALRYVGSRRPSSYPTGCRLAGSPVFRLSVSSTRADSLRSVYRTACPADLDGGCGSVGGRPTVFLPAVCFSGWVGGGHRICFLAVEPIGWCVLRGCRAFRQPAPSLAVSLSGRSSLAIFGGTRLSVFPKVWQSGCSPLVVVWVPGSLFSPRWSARVRLLYFLLSWRCGLEPVRQYLAGCLPPWQSRAVA